MSDTAKYRPERIPPKLKDDAICLAVFELPWAQSPVLFPFHRLVLRVVCPGLYRSPVWKALNLVLQVHIGVEWVDCTLSITLS